MNLRVFEFGQRWYVELRVQTSTETQVYMLNLLSIKVFCPGTPTLVQGQVEGVVIQRYTTRKGDRLESFLIV